MKDEAKQPVFSFINSNIAAWEIGKANTAYIQFDNSADGGEPFGLAANYIAKLSYRIHRSHFHSFQGDESQRVVGLVALVGLLRPPSRAEIGTTK